MTEQTNSISKILIQKSEELNKLRSKYDSIGSLK